MKKHHIIDVMRTQYRVWHDTENSRDILEDTARAIGHYIFRLKGVELNKFAAECMLPERNIK